MKDVEVQIIANTPWEETRDLNLNSEALKIADAAITLFNRIRQLNNDEIPI
jgi:hypothetical protein